MTSAPRFEHWPSPNHGERAPGRPIDMIVLHYTGMASAERALKWLCDPESNVSSHYFIHEDGRVCQLVDEERRAWHAGESWWAGETDINSRSIGIEMANPGHEFGYVAFPDAQVEAAIDLCRDVLGRHAIPAERVLAHSDVAPLRKDDPGELFPWDRLHAAGVGHWVPAVPLGEETETGLGPDDTGSAVADLRRLLAAYGYGYTDGERYDGNLAAVVRAFQRHFRPARVDGIADRSTIETLRKLLIARD